MLFGLVEDQENKNAKHKEMYKFISADREHSIQTAHIHRKRSKTKITHNQNREISSSYEKYQSG